MALVFLQIIFLCGCGEPEGLVVYASQDEGYASQILEEFTAETGIPVRTVYDSEAVKAVGLANRLLAERANPQCDVFWNNEAVRTAQLSSKAVFREGRDWAAFGFRSRRLVINTNLVSAAEAPGGLLELTNAIWNGQVAMAYPLFGTTAAHFLALRMRWGDEPWRRWCEALQANAPKLLDGNSVVVRMVGRGEARVGLTDWDDIAAGQRAGLPVAAVPLSDEFLLIPNTAGLVRGSSRPEEADRLFEYLQRPDVVRRLVEVHALEGESMASGGGFQVDWTALAGELDDTMETLKVLFLR